MGHFGNDAANLMVRGQQPLDPWQIDAVNILCSYRRDGQWAAFEYCEMCPRQNGKGTIVEARVLAGFLLFREKEILWSAHEFKTAQKAFSRMLLLLTTIGSRVNDNLVEVDGILIKVNNSHGKEGFLRLDTGATIKFIARTKNSGRGLSGDLIIIDEAFAYEAEETEAQAPTQLATTTAQTIYTSSPPLSGDTGEPLYELRERAEARVKADAAGDPTDDETLAYRDWGIAGELEDIHRVDEDGKPKIDINWPPHVAAANPALGRRGFQYDRVMNVKKAMRASKGIGFARECLGIWPSRKRNGGQITPARWAELKDEGSKRVGDIAISYDIEPDRSYAAIALYGLRADGKGHWKISDCRPGTDWLPGRLAELRTALDPLCIVSGKGSYESIATELKDVGLTVPHVVKGEPNYHRGHLAVLTATENAAATGRVLDTVKRGTAFHTGQPELDGATEIAQTRQAGDSLAWSRKTGQDGYICTLVTITTAQWGFEVRGPLVLQHDYDVMESIG